MPRQQPRSDDLVARAARLHATGATREPAATGPTVAAHGIGRGVTGTRADLLACEEVADVRALYRNADRCRVAEAFGNIPMNRSNPKAGPGARLRRGTATTPAPGGKKNPAFALFHRPVEPDFEPVWAGKWPRVGLVGPVSNSAPPSPAPYIWPADGLAACAALRRPLAWCRSMALDVRFHTDLLLPPPSGP